MVLTKQLAIQLEPDPPLLKSIITYDSPEWDSTIVEWKKAERFGFDIETFVLKDKKKRKQKEKEPGIDSEFRPWNGLIRILTIGLDSGRCLLIDLGSDTVDRKQKHKKLTQLGFWDICKERLENANVLKVGHNLKFDFAWIRYHYNIIANGCRDTEIASRLMWAGLPSGVILHSLKAVSARVLDIAIDKSEQVSHWGFELSNKQLNYAANDSLIVLDLCDEMTQLLRTTDKVEGCKLVANWAIECAAIPVFAEMELSGMPVNVAKLNQLLDTFETVAKDIIEPFRLEFPGINPDSTEQVFTAVVKKYNILLLDANKQPSTAKEVVSQYWDKPALKALSLSRTLTMYQNTIENVKRNLDNGRTRSSFSILGGTGYGRCTSSEPNLQQLPNPFTTPAALLKLIPKVRTIFEVKEGESLIVSDLKTAHGTIACEASSRAFGDNLLYRALLTHDDIHSFTAANMPKLKAKRWTADDVKRLVKSAKSSEKAGNQLTEDEQTATEARQRGKAVFFGSLNCQGPDTLRDCLRTQSDEIVSKKEATEMIRGWETTYPEVKRFQDKIVRDANLTRNYFSDILPEPFDRIWYGRVVGLSGRRIYLEKRKVGSMETKHYTVKRQDAAAFYWTSTEASIAKLWAASVWNEFIEHPEWNARICNIAHDEINATCAEQYRSEVAECVFKWKQAAMRMFIRLVPVCEKDERAEDAICTNWAQK